MTGKARGRSVPPDATVEWLVEDQQRQIDALAAEIDRHGHPAIDSEIARAERNTVNVRTEMLDRFEGIDAEAEKAEEWNIWGLGFVGLGALSHLGAVVSGILA